MGGVYGLVAAGVVLIYKSTKVLNFAQGELLMIGAFVTWAFLAKLGLPFWLSIICMAAAMAALAMIVERFCLRPLVGQPMMAMVMVTICLSLVIRGLEMVTLGPNRRLLPPVIPTGAFIVGDIHISQQHLYCFLIALLAIGVFAYFFQRTRTGLNMRAVAEDNVSAKSSGISVTRVFALSWIIAGITAGVGGILLGSINGISPELADIGMIGLAVALLGGLESIPGAVLGGIIVGVTTALAAGYLDPIVGGGLIQIMPYVIMMLALLIKPYGLFGLVRIERI